MNTRTIYYIDENEDELDEEVKRASKSSMEENLRLFMTVVRANFAMAGIDVDNQPNTRTIYYIEDEQ